jgi:hypothetical protein
MLASLFPLPAAAQQRSSRLASNDTETPAHFSLLNNDFLPPTAVVPGRAFVASVQVKWMWLVDIVMMMCEVLGLRPLGTAVTVSGKK